MGPLEDEAAGCGGVVGPLAEEPRGVIVGPDGDEAAAWCACVVGPLAENTANGGALVGPLATAGGLHGVIVGPEGDESAC